ncbi:hypothetical protein CAPTEDRAFT_175874 [Capitella teleta]|uniref:Dihydroorotate dehydrogenase (quinone), mitochondrial n=1 Tax=Capitella teleta TaxID=283909 RepID=R7T4P9_CAPTE|nr:hypothetical protein CAPTEDRAFT_175874 [Capitella teleta]|eukprot:ELT87928.1 hypothetical protein CAPTEDRAFT_175874 [Capitella teleta]
MVSLQNKGRSALQLLIGGHVVCVGLATVTGNETWYKHVLMPFMQLFGAESSHWMAVQMAKHRIVPVMKDPEQASLKTQVLGHSFANPIGLAAGFDKQGEAVDGLLKIGFGFVEVGSVTPEPQEGNPKPRVFRLKEDQAVINRYGFNSDGHEAVHGRLQARVQGTKGPEAPDDRNMLNEQFWTPWRPKFQGKTCKVSGILGINLGKNKTSNDAVGDYVKGVERFNDLADYLVVNVSSPNTPGLRAMQGRKELQTLLDAVVAQRDQGHKKRTPIVVKIAPDLSQQDKIDIAAVVARPKSGVDGLIISNTTISRPKDLKSASREETGGLSGQPLKDLSTQTIRDMYKLTHGKLPIIGVGGVSSGEDAYVKLKAGASLIQLYSALAFDGPPLVPKIKRELAELIKKDGYESVSEVVGADFRTG